MALKNKVIFFVISILLFCGSISFAAELTAKEAGMHYKEGLKEQKAYKFGAAEVAYQKVLLLDPHNPMWQKFIMNNRGVMYAQQGDLERAEAAFKAALEVDPKYKPARLNLGLVYDTYKSEDECLKYWIQALDIDIAGLKPKAFMLEEEQQKKKKK